MNASHHFYLFPLLPTEIRIAIWHIVLSTPRVVNITCTKQTVRNPGIHNSPKAWHSSDPAPALLHVNQESRSESLAVYKPYFSTVFSPAVIYLCPSLDTVKFADSLLQYLAVTELAGIQMMILDVKDFAYFGHFNMEILMGMTSLRELEILTALRQTVGWRTRNDYVETLVVDFEDARADDPGWVCPRVTIFDASTRELLRVVDGGAKIPGWITEFHTLLPDDDI